MLVLPKVECSVIHFFDRLVRPLTGMRPLMREQREVTGFPVVGPTQLLWAINLGIRWALSYGLNNASNHQAPTAEESVAASIGG